MKRKGKSGIITACVLAFQCMLTSMVSAQTQQHTEMRSITTMELVRDMGVGINLGNTMESCGEWIDQWGDGTPTAYETAWGSPVVTQPMIEGYADEGFGVVRVPVAWSNLMGDNYQLSDAYMERVQQIVDWIIEADMYAIINIHYDSGWMKNLPENKDECISRFRIMWEQICDGFEDYGDYLMFESQNEELGWESLWNRWSGTTDGKAESYSLVNEVNQVFVDTVRASGGNNPKRHLLISGYTTDIELTCDSLFEMPSDPMNRCAVSVHYYTPSDFAILTTDTDWGTARSTWGTESDFNELNRNMELMKTTFIDNGIPVIIGEYGCPKENKDADSVRLFLSSVCKAAYDRQLCPVLWDITDLHYDRTNCMMYDQQLKAAFQEIAASGKEEETETVQGDVNGDDVFNAADVAALQKWLVCQEITLTEWENADFTDDNILDIFDLCLMKRLLMNK